MLEKFVDVTSKNGPIPTFFVAPDDQHEWPAIIFYMDAPGIREELRNMARRIAKHGYACILPDLYHRYGNLRFKTHQRPEATTAVYLAAYHGLTDEDINDDTAAIIGYLEAQPQIQQGAIGSVGFCMSGRFITTTAKKFPDRFACAASFYGTRLVTDDADSPHLHLNGITAELYYGFGALDTYTPADYIQTFRESLDAAGLRYEMDVFDGVEHGYALVERAPYDPAAAELSWDKVFALFERNLVVSE